MNKRNKKIRKIVVAIIIILICLITLLIVNINSSDSTDNNKNHKKISKQVKDKEIKSKTTNSDSSDKANITNNETDKKENNNTSQNTKVTTTNKECNHDWEPYGHDYIADHEAIETGKIINGKDIFYRCYHCHKDIKTSDGKYNLDFFKKHLINCKEAIESEPNLFYYHNNDSQPMVADEHLKEAMDCFTAYRKGKFKAWMHDGYKCRLCGEVRSEKDYPGFYGNGD